ncbi:MAG: PD-(D/E)XK nuclease family transposase [Bacteroidales bacterium]|nr:PD-(D/E)XK nuclease family transposase [Bacteroidales bacterium]
MLYLCKVELHVPLSDFGFKRLLGTERNKDITIHLLNSLVGRVFPVNLTYLSSV